VGEIEAKNARSSLNQGGDGLFGLRGGAEGGDYFGVHDALSFIFFRRPEFTRATSWPANIPALLALPTGRTMGSFTALITNRICRGSKCFLWLTFPWNS
jgi:hypothetical protein